MDTRSRSTYRVLDREDRTIAGSLRDHLVLLLESLRPHDRRDHRRRRPVRGKTCCLLTFCLPLCSHVSWKSRSMCGSYTNRKTSSSRARYRGIAVKKGKVKRLAILPQLQARSIQNSSAIPRSRAGPRTGCLRQLRFLSHLWRFYMEA